MVDDDPDMDNPLCESNLMPYDLTFHKFDKVTWEWKMSATSDLAEVRKGNQRVLVNGGWILE